MLYSSPPATANRKLARHFLLATYLASYQSNGLFANREFCLFLVLQVTLEKVLGITAAGNRALACDHRSGLLAYPAGYAAF